MSCSSVSISPPEARSRFQESDSCFARGDAASQPDTQLPLVMFLKANSLPSGGANHTFGQLDFEVRRVLI
jgi:hypothetical protein